MHISVEIAVTKNLIEKARCCGFGQNFNFMTCCDKPWHIIKAQPIHPLRDQHFSMAIFKHHFRNANPVIITSIATPDSPRGVTVFEDRLYVADNTNVTVMDIADPAAPRAIGSIDTPATVDDVAVSGSLAYAGNGLQVIDPVGCNGPECDADVAPNGSVDFADLTTVLGSWGPCDTPCASDIDGDGTVGLIDLITVLASWGPCT